MVLSSILLKVFRNVKGYHNITIRFEIRGTLDELKNVGLIEASFYLIASFVLLQKLILGKYRN